MTERLFTNKQIRVICGLLFLWMSPHYYRQSLFSIALNAMGE